MNLTEKDKNTIKKCLDEGKPIPSIYRQKLFNTEDTEFVEATKDYKLVYKGKARKEDIIANTPAAPLQKIRSFNSDNRFEDDWSNMLIFGDNLLALKAIYEDQQGPNHYKTKNKIKLIYIDPPFATKQDFLKDREKAYQDKIIGAQFIEFLRKRLIMLREILADDGAFFLQIDWKKGHYVKTILDEIFGEHNFRNEIVWKRKTGTANSTGNFGVQTDSLFFYHKSESGKYKRQFKLSGVSQSVINKKFNLIDEDGRRYWSGDLGSPNLRKNLKYNYKGYTPPDKGWAVSLSVMKKMDDEGRLIFPENKNGRIRRKMFLDEWGGFEIQNLWDDISPVLPQSGERENYPTQKPEKLVERIVETCTSENDIIMDCFAGSGTSAAVAEKLNRKWIVCDCGKLSIYTIQKRLFGLNSLIGSPNTSTEIESDRILDFRSHSKSNSRGLFYLFMKNARAGDLIITDTLP